MRDLQSLVLEDADCPEAHPALAKQYVLDRQYEQAGRSYLRAIDCYLRQGGHAAATESYEELTALFPECRLNLRLQFRMATALEQQGRCALAVRAFERVAYAYAYSEEAQVSLMRAAALCAERLADPPGALDYLERLAADYPQGPWTAFARRQSARLRRELER
jgi:tetratricopeptide (TPR) repeat protein